MPTSPPLDLVPPRRLPDGASGGHAKHRSSNKGRHFPADPPRTEQIIAVMCCCDDSAHGARARGLIVVLWRAGLRIQEALDLTELDLDRPRGSVLVRRGKGGRRREVGMGDWGSEQLEPWLTIRRAMPVGPFFCVIKRRHTGARAPAPALTLAQVSVSTKRFRGSVLDSVQRLTCMPIGTCDVMRSLDDLMRVEEPAWPELHERLEAAGPEVVVLPVDGCAHAPEARSASLAARKRPTQYWTVATLTLR